MLALLVVCVVPLQDAEPVPPSPFDRVVEVVLDADDPPLEGHGPAEWVEYETEFSGTLRLWTTSELDLFLRVEDLDGEVLGEDEDSGGGTTPYIQFGVEPGIALYIAVASSEEGVTGEACLHLVASPESEDTLEAAAQGRRALERVDELQDAGKLQEARELLASTLVELRESKGAETSEVIADLSWDLSSLAYDVGGLQLGRRACSIVRAHRERNLPASHPALLRVQGALASFMRLTRDLEVARALQESVLETYERTVPEDHPKLIHARGSLASMMKEAGDLPGARALQESVVEAYERTLSADHPRLLRARRHLSSTMRVMGELSDARTLQESLLESWERIRPEDHPDVLDARRSLAVTIKAMGDLAGARAMEEALLEVYERTLPADHPYVLGSKHNLAATLFAMGDLDGARMLQESVLDVYERTLPPDHTDVLDARHNLAGTILAMGDLIGARDLLEAVLEARERTLPEDHPERLNAQHMLASTLADLGDLARSLALLEAVLEAYEQTLPEDHPDLLRVRGNLAGIALRMGDVRGARALQELVLEPYERTLPADHPDLVRARANLGRMLRQMDDLPNARALQESVMESFERILPSNHPELVWARRSLALTMKLMGDLPGARAIEEEVLETYSRTLPAGHPDLLAAKHGLAITMMVMGDLPGSLALQQEVLVALERALPPGHRDLRMARHDLAAMMVQMGDLAGARSQLPDLISGMRASARSAAVRSSREAREGVGSLIHHLNLAIFLSGSANSTSGRALFDLIETRRAVACEAPRVSALVAQDEALRKLWIEVAQAGVELNETVQCAARLEMPNEEFQKKLSEASFRRDRASRAIRATLDEQGMGLPELSSESLAEVVPEGSALVGFLRYHPWRADVVAVRSSRDSDHLLAHVLRTDGTLVRIDLGLVSEIEELVARWRAAMGKPVWRASAGSRAVGDSDRGTGSPTSQGPEEPTSRGVPATSGRLSEMERRCGAQLRERLLDPILAAAGPETVTLLVCPDDLVFLLPLDALPAQDEEPGGHQRLGDRVRLIVQCSFARLVSPLPGVDAAPHLLVLGNADYGAEGTVGRPANAAVAPPDQNLRSVGATEPFSSLSHTGPEIDSVCRIFRGAFESDPVVLDEDGATKAALFTEASRARYLHLATHGWFAPETVKSILDPEPGSEDRLWSFMGPEERVTGFAPMTLCGLALAGANRGVDSLGRVPGIMTAEELATLDLSRCELAVLSACETNVGHIGRAGQGIQSLQTALHAAGARTAITSLWKVDDEATRKLMERFYTYLWVEKLPVAEALWKAKCDLREDGHPVRDWAAWVLSGEAG